MGVCVFVKVLVSKCVCGGGGGAVKREKTPKETHNKTALFRPLLPHFLICPLARSRVNLGGLLKVLHQFGHLILLVLLDGAQGGGGGRRIDALQAAGSGEGALQVGVLAGQSAGQRLQVVEILRSQLVEDARHHVGNALRLRLPGDGEGVRAQRRLHLRIVEVNDAAVLLEHVHLKREKVEFDFNDNTSLSELATYLLDAGNRVDGELLQGRLQLLVVRGGRSVDDLLLPAGSALVV